MIFSRFGADPYTWELILLNSLFIKFLRRAGHLMRMNETRAPIKLFNSEPAGCRGVGRPKNRWIDNVTADLKALGIQNWRSAAQDRQRWNRILDQAKSKKWT